MQDAKTRKELQAIRALALEVVERTSRLEEKPSPVQGRTSRKGVTSTQRAIDRRNKRIRK